MAGHEPVPVVNAMLAKFTHATHTEQKATERHESRYGATPGYCDRKHKSVFARRVLIVRGFWRVLGRNNQPQN